MRRTVLTLFVALLAGCGSSDHADESPTPDPSAATAGAAAPEAAPTVPKAAIPAPPPDGYVESKLLLGADPAIEEKNPDADPEEIFGCTTRKHRVRVTVRGDESTYQAWNKGQTWSEKPALTLVGAARTTRAEDCDAGAWIFRNQGVTYEVRRGGCDRDDSPPPGPWTGKLIVTKGDDVLSQGDCGPSGSMSRGGWTMDWRPGHMVATEDGKEPLVIYSDKEMKDGAVTSREDNTLLSSVGPYISWAVESFSEGGSQSSYEAVWKTIDVTDPDNPIDLRQLFGDEVMFEALKKDPFILAAATEKNAADLDTLLGSLDGGCNADMGPKMLERFAFHHLADKVVGVVVGMGHGCASHRGNFTIIPLELEAPPRLLQELQFAHQVGSMMNSLAP